MAGTPHVTRLPEPAAPSATVAGPAGPAASSADRTRAALLRWIPSALRTTADDARLASGRTERTAKDWVLDVVAFVIALAAGIAVHLDVTDNVPVPSEALLVVDLVGLPIGLALLFFRRRWPLPVAIAVAVLSTIAPLVAVVALVVAFSVASWSRPPMGLVGIAVLCLSVPVVALIWPDGAAEGGAGTSANFWSDFIFGVLGTIVAGGWGLFAGARRQLMASLEERAVRAESEQALRVDQARAQERARIAREMHDVLAHRMSLLSVHAGALEFRPDAPPQDIARAAGVIRSTAHDALEELRAVIGVMRVGESLAAPGADGAVAGQPGAPDRLAPEPPQPTLSAVPDLVEEWRRAGSRIVLDLDRGAVEQLPATVGRTAYRIVQEALTNAGKHAPTARVGVRVHGAPGESLTISVTNPLSVGAAATAPVDPIPGTGLGLVGLRERVELLGGAFAAGVDEDLRRFVLEARLPWPTA